MSTSNNWQLLRPYPASSALLGAAAALCLTLSGCGGEADSSANTASATASQAGTEGTEEQPSTDEDHDNGGDDATSTSSASAAADGDDDAHDAPSDAATPIPASSDGPAQNWPAPEPPDAIYEPTEEGAEALLEYWFEANSYARMTGDTGPLEAVSDSDCMLCARYIDLTQETHPTGWWVQEPDEVKDVYVRLESDEEASGLFLLDAGAFEAYWDGEFHGATPATEGTGMSFTSSYSNGQWQVKEMMWVEPEDNGDA